MRRTIVAICLAAFGCSAHSAEEPVVTSDLVIARCSDQYAEFGIELVRGCIREDLAAMDALNAYPPEDRPRIDACTLRDLRQGWAAVRECVAAGDAPAGR